MKILIIGGTGILGKELSKLDNNMICVGSEYDIYEFSKLETLLDNMEPDLIINCAAIKSGNVLDYPVKSININIIGSCNLSKYCIEKNRRLVYISTDYVYPGINGNYKETDPVLPNNEYSWTKLAGECPVKLVKNHLIIRTSFGENIFPYKEAYDNLIVSKDYVDIIAPKILNAAKSTIVGILNIGTEFKTMFEYASKRNIVEKKSTENGRNFSLNTQKYDKSFKN